jgi:hypothetical protein
MSCVLPAMAQSGPPGGGGGSPLGDPPKSYWGLTATPLTNKRDRVLTENLDGPRQAPIAVGGAGPKKDPVTMQVIYDPTPLLPDTCLVKLYALELSPDGLFNLNGQKFNVGGTLGIMNSTGATGYWNGQDPGQTILPNGSSAGGYALVNTAAQIKASNIFPVKAWYSFRFDYAYQDADYSGSPDADGYRSLRRISRSGAKYSLVGYYAL